MNFSERVFEVSWIEVDEVFSRSLGIFHSKILRIISVARSSAFPKRVRIYSVVCTVTNWDTFGAVLGIQYL